MLHRTTDASGSLYADIEQKAAKQTEEDFSQFNSTNDLTGDMNRGMAGNVTEVQVYGLDKDAHLSALGVTIAVGCSLIMLNAVVFAAIFYQKDKMNAARNMQKAFYEAERAKEDEEDDENFKKPYLLKDAPSSLILHDFENIQAYKEQPIFDLVETSDIKRQLSGTAETELTNTSKPKIKTVTFVEAPTIFCEIPDPVGPDTASCKSLEQIVFHPSPSAESESVSNS